MMSEILVRPQPIIGESVGGYFRRLTLKNGFSTYSKFLKAAFGDVKFNVRELGLEQLSEICGHSEEVMSSLGLINHQNGEYSLGSNRLPEFQVVKDERYCPECTAEQGHIQASWNVSWLPYCTKHKRMLVKICNACSLDQLNGKKTCCSKCEAKEQVSKAILNDQMKLELTVIGQESANDSAILGFEKHFKSKRYGYHPRATNGGSIVRRYFPAGLVKADKLVRKIAKEVA